MSAIITENIWRDSPLSIVEYLGKLKFNGKLYFLVNKEGITVLELSDPESKHYVGDGNMAIPTNEPADLCLQGCPRNRQKGERTMKLYHYEN